MGLDTHKLDLCFFQRLLNSIFEHNLLHKHYVLSVSGQKPEENLTTYNDPKANAPMTASFLEDDMFNLLMGIIGIKKMMISVETWKTAWLIQ